MLYTTSERDAKLSLGFLVSSLRNSDTVGATFCKYVRLPARDIHLLIQGLHEKVDEYGGGFSWNAKERNANTEEESKYYSSENQFARSMDKTTTNQLNTLHFWLFGEDIGTD